MRRILFAAALLSLLLTLSPANLTHLLSLRDYSKAPFVLAAILILAVLVLRPMARAWTLALAALYGAVVAPFARSVGLPHIATATALFGASLRVENATSTVCPA